MAEIPVGAIEVLPQKLLFAPGQQAGVGVLDGLALCANEDGLVRGYAVPHYSKSAFGKAFGPLDLDQTIRFCCALERHLKVWAQKDEPLCVASAPFDEAAHTNVVVLLGAYLIFNLGWTVQSLTQTLGEAAVGRPLPCAWTLGNTDHIMKVRHCWLGFEVARDQGWIGQECFSDEVHASLVCSRYNTLASAYDAAWVVPGNIFLCADPVTVASDPNPCTFTKLWPLPCEEIPEHGPASPHSAETSLDSPPSPISLGMFQAQVVESTKTETSYAGPASFEGSPGSTVEAVEPSTGVPDDRLLGNEKLPKSSQCIACHPVSSIGISDKDIGNNFLDTLQFGNDLYPVSPGVHTELDSTATVCKDYLDANRYGSDGGDGSSAQPFFGFLQELHIKMVIRANYDQENGILNGSYDRKRVQALGLKHVDLPYPDYNGAVPPAQMISKLLRVSRNLQTQRAADAMCIHCKGGFGRSGVYACCVAIDRFDVSGEAMLGWVRIVRPGAITTPEQERFLCSLTGRASLDDLTSSAAGCCVVH
eukprot:TRINITY_DN6387_c0_g1_i1.p1 TRINITY_DN6387_c0_g1~~TRINITY_DN6387_c0_g1_i1.p1  ORF type:complete len:533 (+),score=77.63 TRINITY_DN6387_c0_g1_i1:68-1666(+)